jgi:hypothetical protein
MVLVRNDPHSHIDDAEGDGNFYEIIRGKGKGI